MTDIWLKKKREQLIANKEKREKEQQEQQDSRRSKTRSNRMGRSYANRDNSLSLEQRER